jgi:hypothetical protein
MKVKLLIGRGGPGFSQNIGDIIEVGENEGARMIEADQAELAIDEKPTETATSKKNKNTATKRAAPEKAVKE